MERVWSSRLRWRLRGATQWPAFALFMVGDAVLLHLLPIAGDGPDLFSALLLSGFFNLIVVAALAPLAGWLLRRRRPDLPQLIAGDVAGTALLGALAVVLVALGVAHHAELRAQQRAFREAQRAVRAYVLRTGEPQFRRRVDEASSLRFGDDLYRTCVPGDDPKRWMCVFVFTDQHPPGLRRDRNRAPNSTYLPSDRGG